MEELRRQGGQNAQTCTQKLGTGRPRFLSSSLKRFASPKARARVKPLK